MLPLRPLRSLRPLLSQTGQRPDTTTATTPYTYTHTRPPQARPFSATPKAGFPRAAPRTIPRTAPSVAPRVDRPEWQLRPETPLFELPLSAIDLDAEDNPNVRPYDEEVDGYPETSKWAKAHASIDALAARLAQTEQQIQAAQARMAVMERRRTPWQVLDKDVWAAVLGVRDAGHGNVLHHNGISARLAATPQKVPLLLHKALEAREREDVTKTTEQLTEALALCRTPMEVRRIVSLAVQTAGGRATTAQCSQAIAQQLASFVETRAWSKYKEADGRDTARQVTAMLLNWSYALEGDPDLRGSVSLTMWAVGLWAAALADQTTAMRRFLQVGLGQGTPTDVGQFLRAWTSQAAEDAGARPAVALALEVVLDRLRDTPTALDGARAELFSLLTGVTLLPPSAVGPEVSFRTLFAGLPSAVPFSHLYVGMLAELGGVRTLWEQQQQTGAALDADTLITAVLRYAAYTDVPALPPMYNPLLPTATSGLDKSAANSGVWDLRTIVTYEASRAPARQPPTLFPTLRSVPKPPEEATPRTATTVDDAFRADVAAAFSKESAEESVQAIDALLYARRGEKPPRGVGE